MANNGAPRPVPDNEDAYVNTPRAPAPPFHGHERLVECVLVGGARQIRVTCRGRAYVLNCAELRAAMNPGGLAPAWCDDWEIRHNHCAGAMFELRGERAFSQEMNPWIHRGVAAWVVDE
jgi:hypothetical protein